MPRNREDEEGPDGRLTGTGEAPSRRGGEPGADGAQAEDAQILAAIRALQAGAGRDAFEPIFRRYYPSLYNFLANQPAFRELAEDLAQEALVKAWKRIRQFRFQSSFGAWVRQIGENEWKNAVRSQAAAKRGGSLTRVAEMEPGEEAEPIPPPGLLSREGLTPEELALRRERGRALYEAMEGLPAGMRRAVELRVGHDLKYREIAALMGVGLNTVRSQLHEAKNHLRPVLEKYFDGTDL